MAGSDKTVRETHPLSREIQRGPPCILNSFLERSPGVAGARLSLRLGRRFMSKGLNMHK